LKTADDILQGVRTWTRRAQSNGKPDCCAPGILRFVLTLDNADRLNVLAIANEIDRFGRREDNTDFVFFRRTGSELCAAIFHRSESSNVILRQYLARIDEVRLQRAFMAALDIELHERAPVKKRLKQPIGLWKGLPPCINVDH
jgi:hypothetical protein